jgi:hypothetical protein
MLSHVLETSPEAARAQAEAYRRMGPARRFRAACDMSDAFRRVSLQRIREQHPEFSERECKRQLVFELYGIRLPDCVVRHLGIEKP